MLPRSKVPISRADIAVELIEVRKDGAVFKFGVDTSGVDPDEAKRRSLSALDVVDAFCQRVLDENQPPLMEWDGIGSFEEWPVDELMLYRFRVSDDWSERTVIFGDRYLASCFLQEFCRSQPAPPPTEMS